LYISGWLVLPCDLDFCEGLWGLDLLLFDHWRFCRNVRNPIFYHGTKLTDICRFWATVGPVSAEVIGIQLLPSALSIVWLVLVLPCTFSEPIGLGLRQNTGDIYLHAQIFTGLMYIAAAICMWLLRAWKVRELESMALSKGQREQEILNGDAMARPTITRNKSRASIKSKVETAKGLWSLQRL
jgi:hypothetical protein